MRNAKSWRFGKIFQMLHETDPDVRKIDKNVNASWRRSVVRQMYRLSESFLVLSKVVKKTKKQLKITVFFRQNCEGWCTTKDVVNLWTGRRHDEILRMKRCTEVLV